MIKIRCPYYNQIFEKEYCLKCSKESNPCLIIPSYLWAGLYRGDEESSIFRITNLTGCIRKVQILDRNEYDVVLQPESWVKMERGIAFHERHRMVAESHLKDITLFSEKRIWRELDGVELTGKPDLVLKQLARTILYEIKSRGVTFPQYSPFPSELMQGMAYCWMLEKGRDSKNKKINIHVDEIRFWFQGMNAYKPMAVIPKIDEIEKLLLSKLTMLRSKEYCPPTSDYPHSGLCKECWCKDACTKILDKDTLGIPVSAIAETVQTNEITKEIK